jgi:hypothetical protein
MSMALTRDFRARVKRDAAFRKGLLSEAIVAYLRHAEGVRFKIRSMRAA